MDQWFQDLARYSSQTYVPVVARLLSVPCFGIFGIGTTIPHFQSSGRQLVWTDILKMVDRCAASWSAASIRTLGWMPSGPGKLEAFSCPNYLLSSPGVPRSNPQVVLVGAEPGYPLGWRLRRSIGWGHQPSVCHPWPSDHPHPSGRQYHSWFSVVSWSTSKKLWDFVLVPWIACAQSFFSLPSSLVSFLSRFLQRQYIA